MSEGVCLIQSQSLWRPHFEEEQQRFHASSHMPAFTQAMQACDESHLLPSLTLKRLSSLFALQVGEVHAAHCPGMDSSATKPFALLFTELIAYRQNGVLLQHCCRIIHAQSQFPVTKIPVMYADELRSSQHCCQLGQKGCECAHSKHSW